MNTYEELTVSPLEVCLRNLFYDNDEIVNVSSITFTDFTCMNRIGEELRSDKHNFQPIKITEEMMDLFGFTKCTWMKDRWDINDQFHFIKSKDQLVFRGLGMSVVIVEYVHHLQNIILNLTKKPLNVSKLL